MGVLVAKGNEILLRKDFERSNFFYHIVARVLSFQEMLKMRIVVSKMIVIKKKMNVIL